VVSKLSREAAELLKASFEKEQLDKLRVREAGEGEPTGGKSKKDNNNNNNNYYYGRQLILNLQYT
jgi:hypothetical protein